MNEFEKELDDLLDRLDKVLTEDDMATLIRRQGALRLLGALLLKIIFYVSTVCFLCRDAMCISCKSSNRYLLNLVNSTFVR